MISALKINKLKRALDQGFLIVYPTDTLYALGANIFSKKAIDQVFSLKLRPITLPLPIAVSSIEMIEKIAYLTPLAHRVINHFLSSPLTIILKNKSVPSNVTSHNDTIAIRIPDDPIALAIIRKTGPLTATSANLHGHQTPTTVAEIRNMFKSSSIVSYIDDGLRNGSPSTIVDVTGDTPIILRKGTISSEQIDNMVS
jgi:L-threonylcarbamoyladenylate synthase